MAQAVVELIRVFRIASEFSIFRHLATEDSLRKFQPVIAWPDPSLFLQVLMAGHQAKLLSTAQTKAVLAHLTTTRYPQRDTVMFLLSLKAGLRAKEIAAIRWSMVLTGDGELGNALHLPDRAAKRGSGGTVPLSRDLREALAVLHCTRSPAPGDNIIYSERGARMSAGSVAVWFHSLYRRLGFEGCSLHSGRRTAITGWARKISLVGGSLRDVQRMARHASLTITARYIETDTMCRVVDFV